MADMIEELREEFSRLRRAKIEAVAHKHKDDSLDFFDCYKHLIDESGELHEAMASGDGKRIEEELIDVANGAEFTFIALRKHQDLSKKAHYFVDGISLCGLRFEDFPFYAWGFGSELEQENNCVACMKKLKDRISERD